MAEEQRSPYELKGYSRAEVDILIELAKMETKLEEVTKNYVRREEFTPIQKLVYGMVGVILLAFLSAIIALAVVQQ